jgi:glutamine synthetase
MAELNAELDALKTSLQERGVKYALASFVDIHGMCKAKVVPLSHFGQMMAGSELFTGAALDGVPQDVSDEEVSARPDPISATVLPWNSEMAWFASDLYLKGQPFSACCRSILKQVLAEAEWMGFTFNLGIETEFFILKETEDGKVVPVSDRDTLDKPCYDLQGMLDNLPWIQEIVEAMNDLGWDVYSFDHEDGNGQFETDFAYCDALKMSDRLTFFRLMVKEIARKHGYFATFMPKPFANRTGSGAHYNMSLADLNTGANLFEEPNDPRGCGLSNLGYQFIAGVLRHAPAICAVIAPTVNSYKRLIARGSMSGFTWAPVYICYGNNNRTNMLRIPLAGGRVECRAADISSNPYLGAALILAAGLEGIREELDPGEPHTENMYTHSDDELTKMGIQCLPRNLAEAIAAFSADPLSEKVMGSLMYQTSKYRTKSLKML